MTSTELREQRDKWLLELKLSLQKVIRDKGKCIGFGSFGKKTWLPFSDSIALVYTSGDIVWCWMVCENPNLQPGVHNSVFDPEKGIRVPLLLDFLQRYE